MALQIYTEVGGTPLSVDNLFTNPLLLSQDGRTGGTIEKLLYLRNDEVIYSYADIEVSLEQTEGSVHLIDGSQGFYVKMKAGDLKPSLEEWKTISAGNSIILDDIEDTIHYLPFWLKVEVPPNVPVQKFRGLSIVVTAERT
jgi:hypothetical protein